MIQGVLFGPGSLLDFFREVYPGFFEVDQPSKAILYTNQRTTGQTAESARACLEHAVRLCRDEHFKARCAVPIFVPDCLLRL